MKTSIKKELASHDKRNQHKVKGKNFITPDFIDFYFIPHTKGKAEMLIELSKGIGFDGETIYGITCSNNGESYRELSTCLHSEKEAIEYINNLK